MGLFFSDFDFDVTHNLFVRTCSCRNKIPPGSKRNPIKNKMAKFGCITEFFIISGLTKKII